MAPNGETLMVSHSRRSYQPPPPPRPRRLSTEGILQRAMSDLSLEVSKEDLPPISEVEDARCECCGISEECTPGYIRRVRDRFCGRWICGLCSEAVKEEMERNGVSREEALVAHTSLCVRFNRIGRTNPVIYQVEAMREILKKYSERGGRAKSCSPRDKGFKLRGGGGGGIARSSSCIPAISREITQSK